MYADALRAYSPQNEQEDADRRMILEYIRRFPDNILTRDNAIAHMTSSGFVVNADGATCADVLGLIAEVQRIVREKTGFSLEPEVRFLGEQ